MNFAAGYRVSEGGERFTELVKEYRDRITEVYFPWPRMASGRPPILADEDYSQEEAEEELLSDLQELSESGFHLDLLMNANCYGEAAVSRAFRDRICRILKRMEDRGVLPEIVTTTSPFVASVLKEMYPEIEVRASVNMRIGTIQAMEYVSGLFDSFYLQRDFQRDPDYVREVSAYCRSRGKKLCLLANSGCLRFCPGQTFHDNLIAHCAEAEREESLPGYDPHICWNLYRDPARRPEILKASWIRPEDLWRYEGFVDVVKLATRQHSHPRSVISAYANGRWDGDLLELLEPGFSPAFRPSWIDNRLFPEGFFEKTSRCRLGCTGCGYCEEVYGKVEKKRIQEEWA